MGTFSICSEYCLDFSENVLPLRSGYPGKMLQAIVRSLLSPFGFSLLVHSVCDCSSFAKYQNHCACTWVKLKKHANPEPIHSPQIPYLHCGINPAPRLLVAAGESHVSIFSSSPTSVRSLILLCFFSQLSAILHY